MGSMGVFTVSIESLGMDTKKAEILDQLCRTDFINHENPSFFHGRIYKSVPPLPEVKWECSYKPRGDLDGPEWLTGTEYSDTELVFKDKIKKLARLIRLSEKTVIYSGAGISVAAGINQAARSSGQFSDISTDADPTVTHQAITALKEHGLVDCWIQQNHDGLPQKAGYPQEDIYEIHGSWYDPSNPVVCYDGIMRADLYSRMKKASDTADLVLVLGTSLSGLNSDQVAINSAKRSCEGKSLGTVIVNLQQTAKDGVATLRMFAEADHVFTALLENLGIPLTETIKEIPENCVFIPYNANGTRSGKLRMYLDLTEGQQIRLNPHHNCQGSKQPKLRHIFGKGAQDFQEVMREPGPGKGYVGKYLSGLSAWELKIEGVPMLLGRWWLQVAERGKLDSIPVVNIDPVMCCEDEEGSCDFDIDAVTARVLMEEDMEKERERKSEATGMLTAPGTASSEAQLEEINKEKDKIDALLEKTLKNMEKTKSLVRSLGITEHENHDDNTCQSSSENPKTPKGEVSKEIPMTEDEQLAYALQLSMDK